MNAATLVHRLLDDEDDPSLSQDWQNIHELIDALRCLGDVLEDCCFYSAKLGYGQDPEKSIALKVRIAQATQGLLSPEDLAQIVRDAQLMLCGLIGSGMLNYHWASVLCQKAMKKCGFTTLEE